MQNRFKFKTMTTHIDHSGGFARSLFINKEKFGNCFHIIFGMKNSYFSLVYSQLSYFKNIEYDVLFNNNDVLFLLILMREHFI